MRNRTATGNRMAGFTLIETMIVVVIVAILVGIALPSYQNSITKGRRADAKAALLEISNRQEQQMLDSSTYTLDMTDLGYAASPMVSDEQYYEVSAALCPSPLNSILLCYVLTATAPSGSAQEDDTLCGDLTLSSDGTRGNSGTLPVGECW